MPVASYNNRDGQGSNVKSPPSIRHQLYTVVYAGFWGRRPTPVPGYLFVIVRQSGVGVGLTPAQTIRNMLPNKTWRGIFVSSLIIHDYRAVQA